MARLKLLIVTITIIAFLVSLWAMPALMFGVAFFYTKFLWIRIIAAVVGVLWLLLVRPWTMFTGERFSRFLNDLAQAIRRILYLD